MTTEFEDLNVIGGVKLVSTDFSRWKKWDRVRLILEDKDSYNAATLTKWLRWAEGLRKLPARERLIAIHGRVNKSFPYMTDRRLWGKSDYWEAPVEMARKRASDCEGYAIFKFFLGLAAGIREKDMAVLVGQITSTREFHAILTVHDGDRAYILDNRKRYMIDIATERDFRAMYSLNLGDIWFYGQR